MSDLQISLGAAADEWKSCSQYIMIDTDGSSLARALAVNTA